MISFNWVITLPKHLTADQFDAWYLGIHTELAKVAHKIIRYSINRRVDVQPEVAHGDYFRIAQEYWADWDSMVECWNHTTGWALLGDGMVNMGLQPGTLPGIALTEHTQFDVAQAGAVLDLPARLPRPPDGTITKFIAFGMAKDKKGIKDWYAKTPRRPRQEPARPRARLRHDRRQDDQARHGRDAAERGPALSMTGTSSCGSTPTPTRSPI